MDKNIEYLRIALGSSADAILGASVAIIVFILGYIINGLNSTVNSYLNRKKNRTQIKLLLNELYFALKNQSNLFEQYNDSLILGEPNYGRFKMTTVPSVSILFQIGYEKSFTAHFDGLETLSFGQRKRSRNKGFMHIWEALNYLDQFHNEGLKYFKELDARYWEIMNSFNNMFQRLINLSGGIIAIIDNQKDPDIKKYYEDVYSVFMSFLDQKDVKNPRIIKLHLLEPLTNLIVMHNASIAKIMLATAVNDLHLANASLTQDYKNLVDTLNASKGFADLSYRRYLHLSNNISSAYQIFYKVRPSNNLIENNTILSDIM